MQIVIDIPEEDYNFVKKQVAEGITNPLKICIANGTVLPKGHGRLIDADELRTKSIDVNAEFGNEWWCVDCDDIELAPTVLEADNETKPQ